MALREHLAELRRRLVISVVAIIVGAGVGWWLYEPIMNAVIIDPLNDASAHGQKVTLTYRAIADAFNIKVKVAVYTGIVFSSPVWLYEVWAFITPGLTKKERRTSLWFVAFAVPLFLSGVWLAILVLPKAVAFGAEFALEGSLNQPDAGTVITFASRLIIAMGVAFLTPLFLVGLNMMGLVSGRNMGKHWRLAVFVAFLFAAIVSPSPDATQMIIMALPLVGLYTISVFVSLFNDRRRARKRSDDPIFGLGDDESSPLGADDDPIRDGAPISDDTPIDKPERLDRT
ncbi:twin-arginine translocase subunit TatC [Kineosporia sp. NBRC 101731]|uniref:twin-arginine translocase subunit TatC n=1 Tax=Kineosporia sp. NBRC 101731 TaxID=3032199 RepID=UPI0024A294DE|nr:twin-arginine translocase subunit TatC [Kineosporia sp. NBRC 101731]GLY31842.1 Sec-independent protein translocase protein TatC [Kineosporia sp. NBRC 101731]